jgi:hypothetical protein
MLKAYRTILNLYPARHRAVFEREMLETFAQAQAAWRGRGIAAYGCFVAREFAGLCGGILREWILQGTAKDRYLIAYPLATAEGELPADPTEIQQHIRKLIGWMEFAIAHHDFAQARLCCDWERTLREQLRRVTGAAAN